MKLNEFYELTDTTVPSSCGVLFFVVVVTVVIYNYGTVAYVLADNVMI